MDEFVRKSLAENKFNYQTALERIIDKYSQLQYQDGGLEVNLENTRTPKVARYMRLSRIELNKLESKSLTDLREESMRSQDTTRDCQLDFTHDDSGADETCASSTLPSVSVDDDGTSRNDTSHLTVSSSNESHRSISVMEILPEDQDEELEMTLRSHGSSLVELYPSMRNRIERAWQQQHLSVAADSVLRRYSRWRQQSNRSNLTNMSVVKLRHKRSPRNMIRQTLLKEDKSPVKRQFVGTESIIKSPLQKVQDWRARQQTPGRIRREQPAVLVMDFSGPSETREVSLNETFTVCEVSQLAEQPSTGTFSPSRSYHPTATASFDSSLRSKRLSLTAHSLQTDGCCTYASQTPATQERPHIYSSPVRQSPLQARMMSSLSRSPHAFSRSPKAPLMESFSRESTRPRIMCTSPQKPPVPLRMLHPQDSHPSLHPQLRSPQAAAAGHSLRRHLSFDSSLPSVGISDSPKKLDEDIVKLYHKFVCQSKSSFFKEYPCRLCARNSEATRGSSSSALAALALSPHRSLLRKRHRELDRISHPQAKRFRDEYRPSSPGSRRHRKEMLWRRFSTSEYDALSTKPSAFSTRQHSADAHQETGMSRRHHESAADFFWHGKFT